MLGLVPDRCTLVQGYPSGSCSPGHSQPRQEPAGLHCTAAPLLHRSTSLLPVEIRVQEKAECEPGPSCSVQSGYNQFVMFRWDYGVSTVSVSSEDRLLVAPYRGCTLLRCCARLSTQAGLSIYHVDDRVRFLVILGYEE